MTKSSTTITTNRYCGSACTDSVVHNANGNDKCLKTKFLPRDRDTWKQRNQVYNTVHKGVQFSKNNFDRNLKIFESNSDAGSCMRTVV